MVTYIRYILLTVFSLVACSRTEYSDSQKTGQNSEKNGTVQVNWMSHWYERAGKEDLVRLIAREYELQHQNLSVNVKFIQEVYHVKTDDRRQFNNELVQMIRTGNVTWDILVLDNPSYDSIAHKLNDKNWGAKYLVNFEEFDWFRDQHKSFLFEGDQYRRNNGGIIPGPIIEGIYYAVWFNNHVTKKLGLEVKKTGMTFQDLKTYFKAAYDYNQTHADKISLLYNDNVRPARVLLNALVLSDMGSFNPADTDRKKSLAALRRGLLALQDLSQFKPLNNDHSTNADELMLNEKCLAYIKETYVYNRWARIDKAKASSIFPAELPVFEQHGQYYPGTFQSVYAVLKQAPHKKEAIDIMKYWCSNDVAERWSTMTGNPTGLKVRINTTDFGIDDFTLFNNEINRKYGKNVQTIYLSELLFGSGNSQIDIDPVQVLEGSLSAEKYYENIVRHLK